jgi:alpha-tubulin suppressor-like RCC1 family protein
MQKAVSKFLVGVSAMAGFLYFPIHSYAGGLVAAWGDDSWGQTTLPVGVNNVKAIAAGQRHSLALKSDGTIIAWGYDYPSTYQGVSGATDVPHGLTNAVAVAAGSDWSMALKANGTVAAWGAYGEDFHVSDLSNITAITAGWYHWLALKSDGTIVTWGDGNTSYNPANPGNIPAGLTNIVAISAGIEFSVALKADGTVIAWGWNNYGQTNVPPGLSNVVAIAAGFSHSLALKDDGTVITWGAIGDPAVPPGLSNVVAIAAGAYHSMALKANGTVVTWWAAHNGLPDYGQTVVPAGLSNVKAIAAGEEYSLALVFDGPVQITQNPLPANQAFPYGSNVTYSVAADGAGTLSYQWFLNGQAVGDNSRIGGATTSTLTMSNLQISDAGAYTVVVSNMFGSVRSDGAILSVTDAPPEILEQLVGGSVPLGANFTFTVTALGSSSLTYQWRFNGEDILNATNATLTLTNLNYNQTGYYNVAVSNQFGTVVSAKVLLRIGQTSIYIWPTNSFNFGSAAILTNTPSDLTNAVAIAAGSSHIIVLKRDGTVETWGLSSGATTNVPNINDVTAVAAGYFAGISSSMALKANGTVVVWGDTYNQFGINKVPMAATNITAIADGGDHCLALRSDGAIVGWGTGADGDTIPPAGLSNVVAIAAGNLYSMSLKSDGTIVAWGNIATNVLSTLTNVIAISAATDSDNSEYIALKADGTVINGYASPNATNIVAISAGANPISGAELRSDGTVISSPYGFPTSISNVIAIASGGGNGGPGFVAAIASDGSPFITIQPASQMATNGATVQFHARAIGAQSSFYDQRQQKIQQTLRYQWQFDGENLPGATNADLTLTDVQSANIGDYQAVVTNYLGAVTSKIVQLTVVSAPFSGTLADALNATNLTWNNSATNAPWFAEISITHDGDAAAQSGHISDTQQSILQTTVTGPDTLTFWWKVSSEEDFDFLEFFVDSSNAAAISGEVDWQQRSFNIPPGVHTLKWIYSKDESVSVGQDAGWLDEVTFIPWNEPQQLSAATILSDGSFSFIASNAADKFLQQTDAGNFEIQASTDLVNWVTLTNPLTLTNGAWQLRDANSTNYPARFYRLMEH